jgi:ABC-type phosphate/phosphonate transport system permease subunit
MKRIKDINKQISNTMVMAKIGMVVCVLYLLCLVYFALKDYNLIP